MPQVVVPVATWVAGAVATAGAAVGITGTAAAYLAAGTFMVAEAALYMGLNYAIDQALRPDKPKPLGSELNFNIDPAYPREMLIGERQVGGSMVARFSRGSNLYNAHLVIQVADHPCVELSQVFDGGRLVHDAPLAHGVRTEITAYSFSGGPRVWLTWHDGRPGQTADANLITASAQDPEVMNGRLPVWSSDHRGAGCAYIHAEVQWDSDILTALPQFTFQVKGAKLYDRRKDTTAGGTGTHRLDDPSTWEYSTNARVALDHYLLGYKVEDDDLAFGVGLLPEEVPYADFEAGADLCDEDVVTGTGLTVETIKRYAANGVLSAADYFESTIESFQLQMAARVVDLGGRIGILGAEERAVVVSLTEDDLVSGEPLQFADKLPFSDLIGSVTGTFADPANLYQPTPLTPQVSAYNALPDGGEAQAVTLALPLEVNNRRATRLVSAYLARESLQPRLAGVFMPKAWKLEPGDWFEFTSARLQITDAKFEVIDIVKNDDFTVQIVARAIDPNFLAFSNDNDPDLSVPPDAPPVSFYLDVPEFDVAVTTLEAGGVIEPALEVTLTSDETVAREIVYEYAVWDDAGDPGEEVVGPTLSDSVHVSQIVTKLRKGVLPSTQYAVRAKAKAGRRESPWTDWSAPVTTGATYAVGSAATVPWTGVTGPDKPDDNADVTSANTAAAITGQGWGATASESQVSNALAPIGVNGLVDTAFRFQSTYWDKIQTSGSSTLDVATSTGGLRRAVLTGTGVTVNGTDAIQHRTFPQRTHFQCKPGDVVGVRVLLGGDNLSKLQVYISFRNAAGTQLMATTPAELSSGILAGDGEVSSFNELTTYATAPASTVCATLHCLGVAATSAPVLRMARPLMSRLATGQTVPPLFTHGREHEIGANVTETRTSAAFTGQGALATLSSLAYGGAFLTGFGLLSPLNAINFGSTYLLETSGGAQATLSAFKTLLGTAAAITSQGALATLSQVNLGASGTVYRDDGTTRVTDSLAITSLGTAAAIAGQGSLATISRANIVSLAGSEALNNALLTPQLFSLQSTMLPDRPAVGEDFTSAITSNGTPSAIAALSTGTVVNEANEGDVRQFTTIANIATRGWLAVRAGRTYRATLRTRVTVDGTDNRLAAGFPILAADGTFLATMPFSTLDTSHVAADGWQTHTLTITGDTILASQPTAAWLRARASGGRNAGGTASGATWQISQLLLEPLIRLNDGRLVREDGASALSDALVVTSLGTASAFTGQGALATLSTINSTSLMGAGVVAFSALTSTAVRLGSNITRADGTTSLTDALAVTSLGTAAAFTGQGALATQSLVSLGASGLVYREDGSTHLTDAVAVTSLGTAAAFTGQGALATLSTINSSSLVGSGVITHTALTSTAVRLGTNVVRADGSTSVTDSLVVTSLGTASAISGQGAFATLSSVAYGSGYLTGFGALAALGQVNLGASGTVYRDDGTTRLTDAAAVTSLGTAAAFTGQGALATLSTINSTSLMGSGVVAYTALTSTAVRLGTNITRADGSTSLTDALVVTSLGTASAITSQGALATVSQVNLGASGRVYRDDGTTRLTDALAVTSLGTAAAFTGQGALATLSTINSSALIGSGVVTHTALASTAVRLGTNITREDGSTSLTDSLVVTSLGTASAITGQGSLATVSRANVVALSGSETLNNALVPAGSNSLFDTAFRFQTTYWDKTQTSGSTTFSIETSTLGLRKSVVTGAGVTVNGTDEIQQRSFPQRVQFPCKPGDVVGARVLLGGDNLSKLRFYISFRNAAGSQVQATGATEVTSGISAGTGEETTFNELTNYGTAPANTVCATLHMAGVAATSAPVLRVAKPLIAVLAAGQTVVPPYAPGREHEIGANVTETRTAAAITSQGSLATLSFTQLNSNVRLQNGTTVATDAMLVTASGTAAGITSQGALATLSFVQLNSNVRLQNGSTVATDAMLVTSSGTAAGISGQGSLATTNFVQLGTNVRLEDGTTVVTNTAVVTSLGTASAIAGQGALATVSVVNTTQISTNAVTQGVADETDAAATVDESWTELGDVSVTVPDASTVVKLDWSFFVTGSGEAEDELEVRIRRDSTVIYETTAVRVPPMFSFYTDETGQVDWTIPVFGQFGGFDTDTPGAATYTYRLEARSAYSTTVSWSIARRRLFAQMFKR